MDIRRISNGSRTSTFLAVLAVVALVVAACTPAAPPAEPPEPAPAPPAEPAPAAPPAPEPAAPPPEKPAPEPAEPEVDAVEEFYSGNTLRIIVATTAGSLFDAWGRMMARHMGKYIPGNPTIIVENMPGAGHALAANHAYNVSPRDGSVIVTFVETQAVNQLVDAPGIEFDMAQYQWLGATKGAVNACLVRPDITGVESFEDMVGPDGIEVVFGTTGPGSSGFEYPMLMQELLDARIQLVTGYAGNEEVRLAIERGEVEAYCASSDAVKRSLEPWIEAGEPPHVIVLQAGVEPDADLVDVPLATDLLTTDEERSLFQILDGPNDFAKPFAVPPGVPEDRVAALRQAFVESYSDPAFLDETEQAGMDHDVRTGEQVQAGFEAVLNTPTELVERYKEIVGR